jgi:hypothetical protein
VVSRKKTDNNIYDAKQKNPLRERIKRETKKISIRKITWKERALLAYAEGLKINEFIKLAIVAIVNKKMELIKSLFKINSLRISSSFSDLGKVIFLKKYFIFLNNIKKLLAKISRSGGDISYKINPGKSYFPVQGYPAFITDAIKAIKPTLFLTFLLVKISLISLFIDCLFY